MPKVPATSTLLSLLPVFVFLAACGQPEVIHDFGERSYRLLDEDSTIVDYPADFRGEIQVVAFIFTHCPDICPAITGNLKNIRQTLENTDGIRFVEISFDPERDTPSVLKKYKDTFELDEQFTLLTGDPETVQAVLDEFNIIAEKIESDTLHGANGYHMKHTNRISVMDEQGRVRFEYPGSYVHPEHVSEDIQKLR